MLRPGETFAGYTIERLLGAGGMGEVYVAKHPRLPRREAVKVMAAALTYDDAYRRRFERESDIVASLSHPAIVTVHDRGEYDGRLWAAFELVDGHDLGAVIGDGALPPGEVARIVTDVAAALDHAGARGLVHRDVKPANILISATGRVMLTDFGIARIGAEASELTETGVAVGTIAYASPEQLCGDPLDNRSDQYSLACTAYRALTGRAPFVRSSAVLVATAHISEPPPSARAARADLPAAVDAVLARAMAKNREDRFATCSDFAAAFRRAVDGVAPPQAEMTGPTQPVAPRPAFGGQGYGGPPPNPPMGGPAYPPPSYPQQPPYPPNQYPGPSYPPPKKKRSSLLIGLVIVGVLVVGGAGVALWKLRGNEAPSATTSTSTGVSPSEESSATSTSTPSGRSTTSKAPDLGGIITLDCSDDAKTVTVKDSIVTITGHCTTLTITGNDNIVAVTAADTIRITGDGNIVTWTTGSPKVEDKGKGNTATGTF